MSPTVNVLFFFFFKTDLTCSPGWHQIYNPLVSASLLELQGLKFLICLSYILLWYFFIKDFNILLHFGVLLLAKQVNASGH